MLRTACIAALLSSLPTFADETEPAPSATMSAEAKVMKVSLLPWDGEGVQWGEVTLKVTRCIAGLCTPHQSVKVQVALGEWRGRHGDTMGVVGYEWKDTGGQHRNWAVALRLDDGDEKDRFERETEIAVANVGPPADGSAVATR